MGSSKKRKEKDRDRDREKDKIKEKDKEKERDYSKRDKSRSRSRERSRERDKNDKHSRHHYKDKDKDKDNTSLRKRRGGSPTEEIEKKKVKEEPQTKVKLEELNITDDDRDDQNTHVTTEGNKDSSTLSIEETNKLRAKLGLKPLQLDDENESKQDDEKKDDKNEIPKPEEVFVKTENISAKLEAEKIKERLAIQREKRKIHEKLKSIKGLADEEEDDDDDVVSWVEKNRKIQEEKERAAKKAKLLEEMDEEFGVTNLIEEEKLKAKDKAYSSKSLRGLTVGHRFEAFKEGNQVVLTLRDKDVLNEDEDVLENVNIVEEEKTKKNLENKLKKPEYKPYDEPEFDEFGILKKKSLLSKYDEEIEGVKKESFKIGHDSREKELEIIRMKLRQQEGKVSLELPELRLATEYYTPEEMQKFKKPKKIRKKVLRKKDKEPDLDFDEIPTTSQDHGSRNNKNETEENHVSNDTDVPKIKIQTMDVDTFDYKNQVEDDITGVVLEEDEAEIELQLALRKARKLKERENATATTGADSIEKVATKIRQRIQNENEDSQDSKDSKDSKDYVKPGNIILNRTAEFCRNLGDIPTYGLSGNREEDEDLVAMEELIDEDSKNDYDTKNKWNEVEMNDDNDNVEFDEKETKPILEEEPDVTVGLAGALKLAMKKGYLDKEVKKQAGAPRLHNIQAQTYTIEEKFYDDDKSARRERYNGPISDFREKEGYKPDIKLEYVDDGGKLLDPKEAFRHLSHKFHGKGPGKNKIDKRMKKKEQESKLRQMSSIDTPLNTLKLLQERQKESQAPYVILTGNQKILPPTISKSKK